MKESLKWLDSSLLRAQVVQAWITLADASRTSRGHDHTPQENNDEK